MSGHFGRDKTVALIQSKVYFPGFRQKTIEFIKSCVACQHVKCGGKFEKGGEKLKPIPVPRMPMRQIGIDCITNLPKTDEGFDTIVTAIDYTSKWPESKPLKGKLLKVLQNSCMKLSVVMELPKSTSLTRGENLSTRCVYIPVRTLCTCIFLV